MLVKEKSFNLQPKTGFPKVKVPSRPQYTPGLSILETRRLPELLRDTERTIREEHTIIV